MKIRHDSFDMLFCCQVSAFRDMDKILGRSGACGAGKVSLRKNERVFTFFAKVTLWDVQVRGAWRQPQSNTAFPILIINIVPECPSAAHQSKPKELSLIHI